MQRRDSGLGLELTRVAFLEDGFEIAPSVGELDTAESTFCFTLSPENTDQLTCEVLLHYADKARDLCGQALHAGALAVRRQQHRAGHRPAAGLFGLAPTALSATHGLDEVTELLADAVAGGGAGA